MINKNYIDEVLKNSCKSIDELVKETYEKGYSDGYSLGYAQGCKSNHSIKAVGKENKMSKTKSKRICEWFFKVVEAQRKLNELGKIGEEKNIGITLCMGQMDDTIHIHKPEQFDRLVEALTSVYDEAFVGEIKDEVEKGYHEETFVWRSFKYAEFTVGTIAR